MYAYFQIKISLFNITYYSISWPVIWDRDVSICQLIGKFSVFEATKPMKLVHEILDLFIKLRLQVIRWDLVFLCYSATDSLSHSYMFVTVPLQCMFSFLAAAPSLTSLTALLRTSRGGLIPSCFTILYTGMIMSALYQYKFTILSSYAWHIEKILCILCIKQTKCNHNLSWWYWLKLPQGKHFDYISPNSYKDPLSC